MDGDLAQNAALIAVALVTSFIGVYKYIKTEASKSTKDTSSTDTGQVVAASFIDSRTIRDLTEALRLHMEEFARETRSMNRKRSELITALEETTDAVLTNADATVNMLRFLKRRDYQGEMDKSDEQENQTTRED